MYKSEITGLLNDDISLFSSISYEICTRTQEPLAVGKKKSVSEWQWQTYYILDK